MKRSASGGPSIPERSCSKGPVRPRPPALLVRLASCAALTLPLVGCGGGIWVGFGDDDVDDRPSVSLVASVSGAAVGQTFRLSAAATDDHGVESVSFFRVADNGSTVQLGLDASAPYEWDVAMPATNASSVRFLARATDDEGQRSDMAEVTVSVLRP